MSTFKSKAFQEITPTYSKEQLEKLESHISPVETLAEKILAVGPQIVLIGEGSHGTREFYENRIDVTKTLIERGLCQAVLIEGDLPDTAPLHRFVMGHPSSDTQTVDEVFLGFERFPSWMWANKEMRGFVEWLRAWNLRKDMVDRCGIYGLDIYSMHKSIADVLQFLSVHDQVMELRVRKDYSTLGSLDPQTYGLLAERGLVQGCRESAIDALVKVSSKTHEFSVAAAAAEDLSPFLGQDEAFINELNAEVVVGAEAYYRAMFDPTASSWNLRDSYFFLALEKVHAHLLQSRGKSKVVAWAHNSHLGDARATHLEQPARAREHNLGQLAREKYPFPLSMSVGQLCSTGVVTAADDWGDEHRFKTINQPLPNSFEDLFHKLSVQSGRSSFLIDTSNPEVRSKLSKPRLQRAIGVIYRPFTERLSHYYQCDLIHQFDLLVFEDITSPVRPLVECELPSEEPETYPSGL